MSEESQAAQIAKVLIEAISINDIIALTGAVTTIVLAIINYSKHNREKATHKLELEALELRNEKLRHENSKNITGYKNKKLIKDGINNYNANANSPKNKLKR